MIHTLACRRTPIVLTILLCLSILFNTTLIAPFPAHAAPEHTLSVAAFASVVTAKPGQRYHITLMVTGASGHSVTLRDAQIDGLAIEQVTASSGTHCAPGPHIACQLPVDAQAAQISLGVRAAGDWPETGRTSLQVVATDGDQVVRSNPVVVRIQDVPEPAVDQPAPDELTPTPSVPPDTPCLRAAMAAATKQGALYSQGGALADDPINPATGQPYPRTGPNSFDCSGLIWWAYQQAGVNIGTTTYTQVNDGTAITCTLADLHGPTTTCWAPGDLIFLRYAGDGNGPGAGSNQHVAIYVGNGLFMDCYNHATNCIMHDVARDSFYQRHFWQARRIVSGCEGLAIDPGTPIGNPVGLPAGEGICVADPLAWSDRPGVSYSRGCGPPVLPPDQQSSPGAQMRQFVGTVGWLGQTGRLVPAGPSGVHLHLGLDIGVATDMCRWPLQAPGIAEGQPPPGAYSCSTTWADPLQFLPQANPDTLAMENGTPVPVASGPGDPTLGDALMQLPPPGHPATTLLRPTDAAHPDGTWRKMSVRPPSWPLTVRSTRVTIYVWPRCMSAMQCRSRR